MTPLTSIKMSLAVAGIVFFGAGMRFNSESFRWAGVACVAVAWFLRFYKPKTPPTDG